MFVRVSHTKFGLHGVDMQRTSFYVALSQTEQTAIEIKLRCMSLVRREKSLVRVVFGGSLSDSGRKSSAFTGKLNVLTGNFDKLSDVLRFLSTIVL